jgi:hypothetical protein
MNATNRTSAQEWDQAVPLMQRSRMAQHARQIPTLARSINAMAVAMPVSTQPATPGPFAGRRSMSVI